MSRLLKVKSHLAEVLDELGWDNIPNSQWKQLENIVQLLKPFAQYTSLTSAEESTTISTVIPVIMELKLHLEKMSGTHGISQVANTMSRELLWRFKFATDPTASDFVPLYVTATFLNPNFKDILETNQTASARAISAENVTTHHGTETEYSHDANRIEENSEHQSDNATRNIEGWKAQE